MSSTTPTNVDTSIPEIWASEILRTSKVKGFWGRFAGGEGSGAPIVQKSQLLNEPGDLLHIQTTSPLTGAGITGDTAVLEGSEENLTTSEIKVSPLQYRHGVRVFRRAGKKSIVDLRGEASLRLEEWVAAKMDAVRFEKFAATSLPSPLGSETYTPNAYAVGHGTSAVTVDSIVAADKLTVLALQTLKLNLVNNLANPMDVDGFPHYVLVTHPNATFQLKQESRYESWVREAEIRGASNPFFRGALAVIDGIVIYEHPSVARATNANGVPCKAATSIAFGANAFVEGLDENTTAHEKLFDYDNEYGVAYRFAFQPRRGLEKDSMLVYVAAPDVT